MTELTEDQMAIEREKELQVIDIINDKDSFAKFIWANGLDEEWREWVEKEAYRRARANLIED